MSTAVVAVANLTRLAASALSADVLLAASSQQHHNHQQQQQQQQQAQTPKQEKSFTSSYTAIASKLNLTSSSEADLLFEENSDRIQLIADVGYLLSLFTLVFALLILICIKRLRSPKNNLHLQLFISFIIRCLFHWIQRLFVHEQMYYTLDPDVSKTRVLALLHRYALLLQRKRTVRATNQNTSGF